MYFIQTGADVGVPVLSEIKIIRQAQCALAGSMKHETHNHAGLRLPGGWSPRRQFLACLAYVSDVRRDRPPNCIKCIF